VHHNLEKLWEIPIQKLRDMFAHLEEDDKYKEHNTWLKFDEIARIIKCLLLPYNIKSKVIEWDVNVQESKASARIIIKDISSGHTTS
jgi:hypothetical protein